MAFCHHDYVDNFTGYQLFQLWKNEDFLLFLPEPLRRRGLISIYLKKRDLEKALSGFLSAGHPSFREFADRRGINPLFRTEYKGI